MKDIHDVQPFTVYAVRGAPFLPAREVYEALSTPMTYPGWISVHWWLAGGERGMHILFDGEGSDADLEAALISPVLAQVIVQNIQACDRNSDATVAAERLRVTLEQLTYGRLRE